MMLNSSSKSGHLYLVPDLNRKSSVLFLCYMLLASNFSCIALRFRMSFLCIFCLGFLAEVVLYFIRYFLCMYWDYHIILIFKFVDVVYHIYLFAWYIIFTILHMSNHPCMPGVNPTWSGWMICLMQNINISLTLEKKMWSYSDSKYEEQSYF